MCGLVGILTNHTVSNQEMGVFNQLLLSGVVRGMDSTGVVGINKDNSFDTYHALLPSYELFANNDYTKWSKKAVARPKRAWLAHHRAATSGGTGSLKTVHPFIHGNICLMMNGTVRDRTTLPDNKDFIGKVDSDNVAYAMNKIGAEELLKTLDSPFALSWFDQSDGSVNVIRNSDRPLYVVREGALWAFASEKDMVLWVMQRRFGSLSTNSEAFELEPGLQLKFTWNAAGMVQVERIKRELFKPKVYTTSYTHNSGRGSHYYDWRNGGYCEGSYLDDDDLYPNYPTRKPHIRGSVIETTPATTTTFTTTVSIPSTAIAVTQPATNPAANNSLANRVTTANAILAKHGYDAMHVGDEVAISLWEFIPYTKRQGGLGSLVGMVETDGGYIAVTIANVDPKDEEKYCDPKMDYSGVIVGVSENQNKEYPHPVVYINLSSVKGVQRQ